MRKTIDELRHQSSAAAASLKGLVRRVVISAATSDRLWQFLGYDAGGGAETFDRTRVFQGVGFSSRPRAGKGEAILVKVGAAAAHLVAIATRDLSSEPRDLDEDETQIHTSKTSVRITKDGDVIIKLTAGRQVFMSDDAVPLTPLLNGVVVGQGVDPFTGATYAVLGSASATVLAKK